MSNDPGAGPFPYGYGIPATEDIPIELVPSPRDWGEARQEAIRITGAILAAIEASGIEVNRPAAERACRRILTHYLVTGKLPDRDAIRSAGELGLPDA